MGPVLRESQDAALVGCLEDKPERHIERKDARHSAQTSMSPVQGGSVLVSLGSALASPGDSEAISISPRAESLAGVVLAEWSASLR